MAHALKIIIISAACHFAAYYVLARLTSHGARLRQYLIVSVVTIAVAVILRSIFLAYAVTALFCFKYTRGADSSTRIALFFGLAFTLSFFEGVALNPGVNLGGLSHPRILSLSILLPIFLFRKPEPTIYRLNAIDWAVLLFFIWSGLLGFRDLNITGIARTILWMALDYVIPYLVIRRYLTNYGLVFTAISFALLSQALVGATEAILKWHLHTDIESISGFADRIMAQYKFRWGILRAQASYMNPLIFALFANMSFLCSFIFLLKTGLNIPKSYTKFMALVGLGFSIMGTLSSGSRAGIAGSILIVIVMLAVMWALKRKSDPKKILVAGGASAILLLATLGGDMLRENFEYRVRLLEVSSKVIMSQPLFGMTDPTHHPWMQVLVQGEGIVDIVNTYLAIALVHGLPGLGLFVYAIFGGLNRLYNGLRQTSGEKLTFGLFAFASLVILAFNLATTSTFGWSYLWIWMLLAISSNIVAKVAAENRRKTGPLG